MICSKKSVYTIDLDPNQSINITKVLEIMSYHIEILMINIIIKDMKNH